MRTRWPAFVAASLLAHVFLIVTVLRLHAAQPQALEDKPEVVRLSERPTIVRVPTPPPPKIPPPPQPVHRTAHTIVDVPKMHAVLRTEPRQVARAPVVAVPETAGPIASVAPVVQASTEAPVASAAPATAAPRETPPPVQGNAVSTNWQGLVLLRLAKFKRYPDLARRRGQQGVVYVRMIVDRNGSVLECALDTSSGSASLDTAAVALVREAVPLPPFTADMSQASVEVVLPIAYSLR